MENGFDPINCNQKGEGAGVANSFWKIILELLSVHGRGLLHGTLVEGMSSVEGFIWTGLLDLGKTILKSEWSVASR